jgi:hypothetical protein
MIQYEIIVEGHLRQSRLKDFDGFSAQPQTDGTTKLTGSLPDQSALFFILNRIRDMNLQLVSVQQRPNAMEDNP